jgi:hypothetical protein
MTIKNFVDRELWDFENYWKRNINVVENSLAARSASITGLRENKAKGFRRNFMQISK